MLWMPGHRAHFLLVATECLQFLHHSDIINLHELIASCRCKPIAVLVPLQSQDSVLVVMACMLNCPEKKVWLTRVTDMSLISNLEDTNMTLNLQGGQRSPCLWVPEFHKIVLASRCE